VVYPENLRDAATVDTAETDLQDPLGGAVSRSA